MTSPHLATLNPRDLGAGELPGKVHRGRPADSGPGHEEGDAEQRCVVLQDDDKPVVIARLLGLLKYREIPSPKALNLHEKTTHLTQYSFLIIVRTFLLKITKLFDNVLRTKFFLLATLELKLCGLVPSLAR